MNFTSLFISVCFSEFLLWKDKEEKEANAHFTNQFGSRQQKNAMVTIYHCHRSGKYTSKSKGKRQLKSQGSCRSGSDCPASMRSTLKQDGSVSVEYQKEHCGHIKEVAHQRLSTAEQDAIAGEIAFIFEVIELALLQF